jgi:hypothetical protein
MGWGGWVYGYVLIPIEVKYFVRIDWKPAGGFWFIIGSFPALFDTYGILKFKFVG